jgi:hypothetical protein
MGDAPEVMGIEMPEAEAKPAKMRFADRFLSLFVTPAALMDNIRLYPVALAPLAVSLALAILTVPLMQSYTAINNRWLSNISIERYGTDLFAIADADDEDELDESLDVATQTAAIASTLVGYPVGAFFSALGLYILTKIARGRELRLGQYFSMYAHLGVITAVGSAVTMSLCVRLDTPLDVTSLAAVFMPLGDITMPAFNILSAVTVFGVWITALSVVGIRHINGFSYFKSAVLGVIAFAFSTGLAVLSAGMTFWMFDILDNLSVF